MPIYEFYCDNCNTIFNFLSKRTENTKIPSCPQCSNKTLIKQITTFATVSGSRDDGDNTSSDIDESKLQKAMSILAKDVNGMNEDDPAQAVSLMRKFSDITGMKLNSTMEDALSRIEAGEDIEQVESEIGDIGEDAFIFDDKGKNSIKKIITKRDETLYEL